MMKKYIIASVLSTLIHILLLSIFANNNYKPRTEIEPKIFDVKILKEEAENTTESSTANSNITNTKARKKIITHQIPNRNDDKKKSVSSNIAQNWATAEEVQTNATEHLIAKTNETELPNSNKDIFTVNNRPQEPADKISNTSFKNNKGNYGADIDNILEEIYRRLSGSAKRSYPYKAKRLGIEGKVIISFRISKDGKAENIRVKKTSGEEILDNAAIKIVENGSPYPIVNDEIDVPIIFSLTRDN